MMFGDFRNHAKMAAAKAICEGCPLTEPCLQYALDHSIGHGVWGGTVGSERGLAPNKTPSWTMTDAEVKVLQGTTAESYQLPHYDDDFGLYEDFTAAWTATVQARKRRAEILARVDAELLEDRRTTESGRINYPENRREQ